MIELERQVARLAALDRSTASAGENHAARLIAAELRDAGARVELVPERVHGTYWRPLGLTSLLTLVAAAQRSRLLGAGIAGACAAAAVDDLEMGPRLVRRMLSARSCTNVVAAVGPADADETVFVHAHHDAAHTGIVFHPEIARAAARRFGGIIARLRTTPPMMWGVVAAPSLVSLGHAAARRAPRRLGGALAAAYLAAFADIGRSPTVPGANDNLSGVAVLLALARALGEKPPRSTRVILFSSGAEESLLEGLKAYATRSFRDLPPDRIRFVVVESVGSARLLLLDGEGLLRLHRYTGPLRALLADSAAAVGVDLDDPFRFRFATGGQIPLRAGYDTAVISSIDWHGAPRNYHWPSDRPEALDYDSVRGAAAVVEEAIRRIDRGPPIVAPATSS